MSNISKLTLIGAVRLRDPSRRAGNKGGHVKFATNVLAVSATCVAVAGCAVDPRDIGRAPHMTPVGTGLAAPEQAPIPKYAFAGQSGLGRGSLWNDANGNLFRDQRASRLGDVFTINISINDKAQIGNSTDRSRESQVKSTLDFMANMFGVNALGAAAADIQSNSSTKGQGAINRSEKIQLSVAAVVTGVLPNGNLMVRGSQEIRVNYELRVLEIAGIVRPVDITRDNTIAYDKIAEARVSYGGRGRLMEVQQPNVVHQVYDQLKPF
ncbi:MAG: flagellar basal body L-ring protein FlgH [Beijerinckiaceae bacterium]